MKSFDYNGNILCISQMSNNIYLLSTVERQTDDFRKSGPLFVLAYILLLPLRMLLIAFHLFLRNAGHHMQINRAYARCCHIKHSRDQLSNCCLSFLDHPSGGFVLGSTNVCRRKTYPNCIRGLA